MIWLSFEDRLPIVGNFWIKNWYHTSFRDVNSQTFRWKISLSSLLKSEIPLSGFLRFSRDRSIANNFHQDEWQWPPFYTISLLCITCEKDVIVKAAIETRKDLKTTKRHHIMAATCAERSLEHVGVGWISTTGQTLLEEHPGSCLPRHAATGWSLSAAALPSNLSSLEDVSSSFYRSMGHNFHEFASANMIQDDPRSGHLIIVYHRYIIRASIG